jgi:hypothetical protein
LILINADLLKWMPNSNWRHVEKKFSIFSRSARVWLKILKKMLKTANNFFKLLSGYQNTQNFTHETAERTTKYLSIKHQ